MTGEYPPQACIQNKQSNSIPELLTISIKLLVFCIQKGMSYSGKLKFEETQIERCHCFLRKKHSKSYGVQNEMSQWVIN